MPEPTVTGGPGTITGWDDPQERLAFYRRMLPTAQAWSAKTGIPVAVYLAINAHESNFGKSDALFGIKGTGTRGSQNLATWEAGPNGERININDSFRAYNNDNDAYADFHNLTSQGRYAPAWQAYQQHHDPLRFLNDIVQAGYATDKQWATKIGQIANRFQQEMEANGIDPGAFAAPAPTVKVNRTPAQGPITSRFGSPVALDGGATYQGKQYPHFNRGVDIGAAGGSPVTAVVGGTVTRIENHPGWGPRVVITDQQGFEHNYGHLDPSVLRTLAPGSEVQAGQQIGTVFNGKIGVSSGPHLSYDVTKNGELIDPTPWIGEGAREQGIPAGRVAPSYLGAAGGAMTATPSGFYGEQLTAAQAD